MRLNRVLWLQLLIGTACGNDTTRLIEPEATIAAGLPALDASGPAPAVAEPPQTPRQRPNRAAAPAPPDVSAEPEPDAGGSCTPAAEVPMRLRWLDVHASPGCVYFPASLAGSGLVTPESDAIAQLVTSGESFELQLPGGARFRERGSTTQRASDLVFQRVLQCPATSFGFTPGSWRVTEELSGSWIGPPPSEGCDARELIFTGVYRYDECELQFERSCSQGPELGNCSVSARFELAGGEAGGVLDERVPSELAGACRVAPADCEGAACAPLGAACTRDGDCAIGTFCDDLSCSGARVCALVPGLDDCPIELDAPACGCDGIPHDSVCLANAQALSATPGACEGAP